MEKLKNKILAYLQSEAQVTKILCQDIREGELKMVTYYESRTEELGLLLAKEIEKRKEYFKNLDSSLAETLPSLNGEIAKEIEEANVRIQDLENQMNQTAEEFSQSILSSEKKQEESFE